MGDVLAIRHVTRAMLLRAGKHYARMRGEE